MQNSNAPVLKPNGIDQDAQRREENKNTAQQPAETDIKSVVYLPYRDYDEEKKNIGTVLRASVGCRWKVGMVRCRGEFYLYLYA